MRRVRTALRHAANAVPQLMDLARLVRSPGDELAIWRDVIRTRRALRFLRTGVPQPAVGAPVVVVPLVSDWVFAVKMHLLLASALRLRGWRVVAVVENRRSRLARRYCSAFGISDIVALDEVHVPDAELARAHAAASALLSEERSFRAVKAWTFEESWIGPQLLSTVARTGMGAPDPRDPSVGAELERLLPMTLEQVLRSRLLFRSLSPRLCIVNEANYALTGALVDAAIATGTDVIHFTQPWRDDALMCKRLTPVTRRMHPSSVSPETLDRLVDLPWTDEDERAVWDELRGRYDGRWFLQGRNQPGTKRLGRDELVARLGLDPTKPIAAIFVHVLWDANLFYGEDLFEDYADWFAKTIPGACANDRVSWIVKVHPANVWKRDREGHDAGYVELDIIRATVGELPPHVRLLEPDTDVSTFSLFEAADFGLTVRGTPGMEHACFGKTVITAGTGRYSGLGFTVDPSSVEEYLDVLARLPDVAAPDGSALRAKRHAHAVFALRPWVMRSFRPVFHRRARGAGVLDENVDVAVASLAELTSNGDLDRWAAWAADSTAVDYLAAPLKSIS